MHWLVTAAVSGTLTLLDLDRTFYVPSKASKRNKLYGWWWGFVLANAAVAVLLYFAVRGVDPFIGMNDWVCAISVGLGYLAIIRLKFSTFSFKDQDVPFGFEALYESMRQYVFTRINRIARSAREAEVIELADDTPLAELARRVRLNIENDALLDDKEPAKQWLAAVLQDAASTEPERKDALAMYLLSGVRST